MVRSIIPYTITAGVPNYPYNASNTEMVITDTPASGVTIDSSSVHIFLNSTSGTELTISNGTIYNGVDSVGTFTVGSSSPYEMTATFTSAKDLNASSIIITYNGSLGASTPANPNPGNNYQNTVTMTYPKDVYKADSSDNRNTSTDTATVTTLGIKIIKTDGAQTPTYLGGAEFKVYSDSAATQEVTCYGISGTSTVSPIVTGAATDTANLTELGSGFCRGLAEGTYYIKETKAPTGYNHNNTITPVTLSATNATSGIDFSSVTTGYQPVIITNDATTFGLPFTGGRGVVIYAIVGIGIVSIASVYYYRKKTSEVK